MFLKGDLAMALVQNPLMKAYCVVCRSDHVTFGNQSRLHVAEFSWRNYGSMYYDWTKKHRTTAQNDRMHPVTLIEQSYSEAYALPKIASDLWHLASNRQKFWGGSFRTVDRSVLIEITRE